MKVHTCSKCNLLPRVSKKHISSDRYLVQLVHECPVTKYRFEPVYWTYDEAIKSWNTMND